MNITDQFSNPNANQYIAALNEVFEILNHVSTHVVLVEDTPASKRYTAEYGGAKAYISIKDTNAIINICYGKGGSRRRIELYKSDADVKEALMKLQEQLNLQSKLDSIMKPSAIIDVPFKTINVPHQIISVPQRIMRVGSVFDTKQY